MQQQPLLSAMQAATSHAGMGQETEFRHVELKRSLFYDYVRERGKYILRAWLLLTAASLVQ